MNQRASVIVPMQIFLTLQIAMSVLWSSFCTEIRFAFLTLKYNLMSSRSDDKDGVQGGDCKRKKIIQSKVDLIGNCFFQSKSLYSLKWLLLEYTRYIIPSIPGKSIQQYTLYSIQRVVYTGNVAINFLSTKGKFSQIERVHSYRFVNCNCN